MTVWIVSEHWHYERRAVREVFDSKKKALAMVMKEIKGDKSFKLEFDWENQMRWSGDLASWQIQKWEVA